MARLHVEHAAMFETLAREAARTGMPIARPLAWRWPEGGFERVADQFMLGDELMVAPIVESGARRRKVVFPPGQWQGDDGAQISGPGEQIVEAALDRLPRFRLVESAGAESGKL
jgi:alpha-glucosidase (family GH31 glycosyl hydrolase)